ncbi:MAG TPA: xanthine dehydrogenase family protein molybdopterin-binding subunit [Alphaproteobacteria bacterium]|nr:xanthine dehydrogenase family protein molybdopterin-binding subunit [Alphaproteobacteria bacterium]
METQTNERSVRRLEDTRFLTGRGRYVEDVALPRQVFAHVVRSPHAHAVIERIEAGSAREMAGVLGVFTEVDLRNDGIGPLPCMAQLNTLAPLIVPPRYALARDRVRHVGDPVALLVAETRDLAREAADAIEIDYRPLASVVDGPAALAAGAPLVWDEISRNLSYRFQKGDREATLAAFARASHTVEIELVNNRVIVVPIEPRAAIGSYDMASDRLHLLLTGQNVHGIRRQLAEFVFRVPEDRIAVTAPDVGGGFGMKNFLYPEWVLVLWAARRFGRPVKWIGERTEDFVSSTQGRDNNTRARLALDGTGRFLALEVSTIANQGAYLSSYGPLSATTAPSTAMGGVYAIPAIFMDVQGAFTNTVPVDAYRGAGKPEANYLIERLVDLAARTIGFDPFELRRLNVIDKLPYRSALGMLIDSGRFGENIADAAIHADRSGFDARKKAAAQQGRLRGLGVACFLETARGQPNERAEIRFDADGRVSLVVGTQSNGQGHETSYAQIASDLLGLPLESFRLVQADTGMVKSGAGHGGARSMHLGGGALVKAAHNVIAKGRAIATHLLQALGSEVGFASGRFTVSGTQRSIGILDLARAARDPANLPDGIGPGLDDHADNISDLYTFPNGCHVAEVEIDPDTGVVTVERYTAVDDYGRLINPLLTEGQVQGGLAQGIGQALLEHTVYDPRSGQLLSGSLMDYALPRADDLPNFDLAFVEEETQSNPLGVKGSGQAGAMAAPQVILNAVMDALAPLGIRHLDMPATPERIWRAIRAARN